MRPDVVDDRKERADKIEEPAAVADFHRETEKPKRKNRDIPIPTITRGRFVDDLKKATRKRDNKGDK